MGATKPRTNIQNARPLCQGAADGIGVAAAVPPTRFLACSLPFRERILLPLFYLVVATLAGLGYPNGSAWAAEAILPHERTTVVAAIPRSFPPIYQVDDAGHPRGFGVDVMDEVARRAGLKVTYQVHPTWKDVLASLRDGRADLIPDLGITPQRAAQFKFTEPVEAFGVAVFVRASYAGITGPSDLSGHRVSVVAENAAATMLGNRPDVGAVVFTTPNGALFALLSGQVDAFVYPEPTVWKLAAAGKIEDRIRTVGAPLVEVKRAMAVRKRDAALAARLNKAILAFRNTAAYRRIYTRWYGAPPTYWTNTRVAIVGGVVLALALLLYTAGFFVWRYRYVCRTARELQVRVAARTEDVRRHAAQLEATNKELEAFAYSVSHDLRTPLRAVDGFTAILLEEYADRLNPEGKRLLAVVRDNALKMGRLIEDILRLSRAGRLELQPVEIDMESLVRATWKELAATLGDRRVRFSLKPLPQACGDHAAIRQVVSNLLANAIKFTRFRDDASIEVGGYPDNDEIVYYVRDNGAGFDMKYASKLFRVFQRLHPEEEFEGTGVGLAIVGRTIAKHGGRVWAEGKANAGATFYFALPTPEKIGANYAVPTKEGVYAISPTQN